MRYFTVEKEIMRGAPECYTVNSDGTQCADMWETDWVQTITTGFSVHEYEENGEHDNTEFYPVHTDTASWTNDEDEVLKQIKADYPATEWQNNEW